MAAATFHVLTGHEISAGTDPDTGLPVLLLENLSDSGLEGAPEDQRYVVSREAAKTVGAALLFAADEDLAHRALAFASRSAVLDAPSATARDSALGDAQIGVTVSNGDQPSIVLHLEGLQALGFVVPDQAYQLNAETAAKLARELAQATGQTVLVRAGSRAGKTAQRWTVNNADGTKAEWAPGPTFHPIDDQVLIRRSAADTITAGGVHVPERDAARPLQGVALAVGPGRRCLDGRRIPCVVQAGDLVLHGRYVGTELQVDGIDCLVLRESEILGVLEGTLEVLDGSEIPGTAESVVYQDRGRTQGTQG